MVRNTELTIFLFFLADSERTIIGPDLNDLLIGNYD